MINQDCVEKCPYIQKGVKCLVGDPVDKLGRPTFDWFCLYFSCREARDSAKNAWIRVQWSDTISNDGTIKPETHEVIVSTKQDTVSMELMPFQTPKQKPAGVLPGYQMYINHDGDIFGRNHKDGKIYPTGINAWTSTNLK